MSHHAMSTNISPVPREFKKAAFKSIYISNTNEIESNIWLVKSNYEKGTYMMLKTIQRKIQHPEVDLKMISGMEPSVRKNKTMTITHKKSI